MVFSCRIHLAGIADGPDKSVEPEICREARRGPLAQEERPTAPAAHVSKQPDQPLIHVAVYLLKLQRGVSRAEVVAPAPQDGIEEIDHLLDVLQPRPATAVSQLPDSRADAVHRPRGRPPEQVLAPLEVREHDVQVASQEDESLLAEPKLDNPRFIRVQLQAEPVHDETEATQRLFRVCLAPAEHDRIVCITHQLTKVPTLAFPQQIENVQVDVGEQRRDDTALGATQFRALPPAVHQHPRLQPLSQEFQYPAIRYALFHEQHQLFVVDGVEEFLDVDLHHVSASASTQEADRFQRVGGALLRPESVRASLEVSLEDGFDDDLGRRLHHTIAHRGDPQRPLRPIRLRNVLAPHRVRPVHARAKALLCVLQKRLHAFLLDHRQRLTVDAGSPLIRLDPLPCLCQNVTPADPVIQRMEAPRTASFGGHEKPALELSHFARRVVGCRHHALALTPRYGHDQSRALSLQRLSPPSSLLWAPRTPSRHGGISPSAYTHRLCPTWAVEEGLPSSASGCPCVLSSIPRKRPGHSGTRGQSVAFAVT